MKTKKTSYGEDRMKHMRQKTYSGILRASHRVVTGFLIALITCASVGITAAASRLGASLEANIFMRGAAIRTAQLIAQLETPAKITDPLLVCAYVPPAKPEYSGEIMPTQIKVKVNKGDLFSVSMYVKNTGNTTWFGDSSGCKNFPYMHLGTARARDRGSVFYNPGDNRWVAANRIAMVEPRVDPGDVGTFTFSSYAPGVNDVFKEYFQPVVEGKQWLEDAGNDMNIEVSIDIGNTTSNDRKAALYLGKSSQASLIDLAAAPIIDVSLADQKMRLKFGDTVAREYNVSTGSYKTPTPQGEFKIKEKQELRIGGESPHYRMPMFQMFTNQGAGFHSLPYLADDRGTFWNEALNHIGQPVSHGCVRLLPHDAEEFYKLTEVGWDVVIHS